MLKPKVLALLLVAIFSIGVLTSCAQTPEDSDTVALSDSLSAVTGDDDSSDADSELTTSDESSTMTTTTTKTTTTTTTKKASSTTTTTKKPETTTTKQTTTTTAKPTTTTTKYDPPPATTTQYSPPATTTTPYEPPVTAPTTTAPPETTTTTTTTTPAPSAPSTYDDQMAQELRQAGENEFYSIVEYAEMYHWRVENVRIIRETDTQFGICGRFFEPFSTEPDIYSNICIKAYLSSGAIQCSDWIIPVTGPDESNYDSYDYYMSRDSLLEAIRGGGYLDN